MNRPNNGGHRDWEDPYNPEENPKLYRESHGWSVNGLHKYQRKVKALHGSSSLTIVSNEFLGTTVYCSHNSGMLNMEAIGVLTTELQQFHSEFVFSRIPRTPTTNITDAMIRSVFSSYNANQAFPDPFFELSHISTQILMRLGDNIEEIVQILQRRCFKLTLKQYGSYNYRIFAMFIALSSLEIDFDFVRGLNELKPAQQQMKLFYRMNFEVSGIVVPDEQEIESEQIPFLDAIEGEPNNDNGGAEAFDHDHDGDDDNASEISLHTIQYGEDRDELDEIIVDDNGGGEAIDYDHDGDDDNESDISLHTIPYDDDNHEDSVQPEIALEPPGPSSLSHRDPDGTEQHETVQDTSPRYMTRKQTQKKF